MELSGKLNKYIEQHTTTADPVLSELSRETHLKVIYPRMLSGQTQGKFLEFLSLMIQPENILEIGTYTGYSAICLAKGLKTGGELITIEKNDELHDLAARYFKKAKLDHCITQIIGDALTVIPELNRSFDLVFIDAEKKDYIEYYKRVFPRVKKGGFILADNVLWDGKVIDPKEGTDKETSGIIAFNEFIQNDTSVENVIISIRDGISLIRKL